MGIDPRFYNNNRPVEYTRNSNEVKKFFGLNHSDMFTNRRSYPHFYRKVNGRYKLKNINWNKFVDPITTKKININKAFIIKNSRGEPQLFNKSTLQRRIIQQLHNGETPSNPFNRKKINLRDIVPVPRFIKEDIRKWKVENRKKRGKPTPNLSAKNRSNMIKKLRNI